MTPHHFTYPKVTPLAVPVAQQPASAAAPGGTQSPDLSGNVARA